MKGTQLKYERLIILKAKNINVICLKEQEALALIYSGKSKTYVRNKLRIKAAKLNKWIEEDFRRSLKDPKKSVQRKATHMFFYKIPKKDICKIFCISQKTLEMWIYQNLEKWIFPVEDNNTDKTKQARSSRCNINMDKIRQDGFSRWNDSLFKKYSNDKT